MQARVGREIAMHLHWQCAHTFFFFDFPGFIRVGDLPGGSVAVEQKTGAIAHLGDWCTCTQVPHGRGKNIGAFVKKRSEIVGLVAPVREVAAAGTDTHALPIDVEEELVVGGYVDVEMLRSIGELDGFSEVEDGGVFLRRVGSGDPLCGPESGLLGRGKRDDGNDEKSREFAGHAGNRTSDREGAGRGFRCVAWLRIPRCPRNEISLLKNGVT